MIRAPDVSHGIEKTVMSRCASVHSSTPLSRAAPVSVRPLDDAGADTDSAPDEDMDDSSIRGTTTRVCSSGSRTPRYTPRTASRREAGEPSGLRAARRTRRRCVTYLTVRAVMGDAWVSLRAALLSDSRGTQLRELDAAHSSIRSAGSGSATQRCSSRKLGGWLRRVPVTWSRQAHVSARGVGNDSHVRVQVAE